MEPIALPGRNRARHSRPRRRSRSPRYGNEQLGKHFHEYQSRHLDPAPQPFSTEENDYDAVKSNYELKRRLR